MSNSKGKRERIHGSKSAAHFSGSCMAIFRSTPDMGGPFMRTHRQGCPRVLMALQQGSLGGMGLKGATAALQGISCTRAEKNVLPQALPSPCSSKPVRTNTRTKHGRALESKSFIL
ncbi:hypothetical protein DITRI_Ditri13aG0001500 [Diplodiscus trichospermus]